MTETSRVGFVVVKASVAGAAYYLMRANPKWKDVNFIGGHEKDRDGSDLAKTARRELWEEVPSIRSYANVNLIPLTSELQHGPISSRSRGVEVIYHLQFFLLRLEGAPNAFVEQLSWRTRNIWIPEDQLLGAGKYRVSGLVALLDGALIGGLRSVPFSFSVDLAPYFHSLQRSDGKQLEFALK